MCPFLRRTILLSLLLIPFLSGAQTRIFRGLVTDEANKAIPFAAIQVKGAAEGGYCDEEGNFRLSVKSADAKELTFFCVGYQPVDMAMADMAGKEIHVVLKEKYNQLDEVAITAKATKKTGKSKILGESGLTCEGQAYMNVGTEYGIYLRQGNAIGGTLEAVYIYITNLGIPDSRFRIHVYDADGRNHLAGEDITGGNVIVHAAKGDEWVRIDVSDKNIPIKGGIIVSMEWIATHGNDNTIQKKGVMNYQGAVMGLTTSYGQMHKFVRFPFENRQASNAEWLVPMIYCTYKK